MKKTALLIALAAVMVFAFAASAFADHSPNMYIGWDAGAPGNSNGPHTDYSLTSTKCAVCHAVHRAAVPGESWTLTDRSAQGRISRPAWSVATTSADTQMLLRSSVADACNYCHIDTSVGGIRLYNGNSVNRSNGVNSGFAHGNGCSSCHAVHGAKTFKGPIASKNLRYDIKSTVVAGVTDTADHTVTDPGTGNGVVAGMQDEIFEAGASASVAAGNNNLFPSVTAAVNGTGYVPAWGTARWGQSTAFCTGCHANYGSASEAVVNLDGDLALFSGASWAASTGFGTYRYKNHPVGPATGAFAAGGDTTLETDVAWSGAESCRACHDAGETDSAPGVVENSYPHATPGFYKFMGAGLSAASYVANPNPDTYADGADIGTPTTAATGQSWDIADGHCLKCHNAVDGVGSGVGKSY